MSSYRLTPKQEAFCQEYMRTGNASEAYRQAYTVDNMGKNSIHVAASKLLNHPNIQATIEGELEKTRRKTRYTRERAIEMALDDWDLAREVKQVGAAVSANRLAGDFAGFLNGETTNIFVNPVVQLLEEVAADKPRLGKPNGSDETEH